MRDFLLILQTHNYFKDSAWNRSDFRYTFETGSVIEFFSADQPSKVRGPRRERLFLNEANNVAYEAFDQLEVRTREFVILDWNPLNSYWFYEEVLGKRDDVEHIILTYKDNEALDPNIVRSIEQRRNNPRWWRVYGEGLLGEADGRIYTGWQIIDEIPHEARLERRGLDFGYTCLKGDTLVQTLGGEKRIDAIKAGEFVLTRNGYQRVRWAGSRGAKPVYEVDFGYGRPIIGTGDHLVFTRSGWKRIDELSKEETVCVKKLSLREGFIGGIRTVKEKTISFLSKKKKACVKAEPCTETCTQSTMAKSQKGLLSTILTGTLSTTIQRISKHFPTLNTLKSTTTNSEQGLPRSQKNGCKQSMLSLGTEQTTGTSDARKEWKRHLIESNLVLNARSLYRKLLTSIRSSAGLHAGSAITHATRRKSTFANTVQKFLLALPTILGTHVQKRVQVSCRLLSEPVEVFDLSVENDPEYFANSVLVHNCDPTAIIDVYKYNGGYIFDENTYQKGLSNKQIADKLLNSKQPSVLVVCDSAEPKSIDELKLYGVSAIGADKSRGSVNYGIQFIQNQPISITKRSINGIKEYRNYLWMKDRDGRMLNTPEGGMDHCFARGSRVHTASGLVPIEELVGKSGFLFSINGEVKRFHSVRETRTDVEVVELLLNDGSILAVTEDHLLLQPDGTWKEAGLYIPGDLIQSVMYDPHSIRHQARVLWQGLCKVPWGKILQGAHRTWDGISSQVRLGNTKRGNTEGLSCPSQKPRSGLQRAREPGTKKSGRPFARTHDGGASGGIPPVGKQYKAAYESVAFIRRGEGVAQITWDRSVQKEKAIGEKLRSLPLSIYNASVRRVSALLRAELQDESETKKIVGVTRRFEALTYNMEVDETEALLVNGVVAHNCMDAARYAMSTFHPIERQENQVIEYSDDVLYADIGI